MITIVTRTKTVDWFNSLKHNVRELTTMFSFANLFVLRWKIYVVSVFGSARRWRRCRRRCRCVLSCCAKCRVRTEWLWTRPTSNQPSSLPASHPTSQPAGQPVDQCCPRAEPNNQTSFNELVGNSATCALFLLLLWLRLWLLLCCCCCFSLRVFSCAVESCQAGHTSTSTSSSGSNPERPNLKPESPIQSYSSQLQLPNTPAILLTVELF